MATIQQLKPDFDKFKQAFQGNQNEQALKLLTELKKKFVGLKSFLPQATPNQQISPDTKQEILLVRETLELAILLCARIKDLVGFERHIAQVKTYYTFTAQGLDKSSREPLILGLNLLRLLAQTRIAEFHTELELIPIEQQSNMYIKHAIELEIYLMEGSYNKLRSARQKVPAEEFGVFMDMLMETVRKEISDCAEKAYNNLKIVDAQKLLTLKGEEETRQYIGKRGWTVREGGIIDFSKSKQDAQTTFHQTAKEVIHKTMSYAKAVERIV